MFFIEMFLCADIPSLIPLGKVFSWIRHPTGEGLMPHERTVKKNLNDLDDNVRYSDVRLSRSWRCHVHASAKCVASNSWFLRSCYLFLCVCFPLRIANSLDNFFQQTLFMWLFCCGTLFSCIYFSGIILIVYDEQLEKQRKYWQSEVDSFFKKIEFSRNNWRRYSSYNFWFQNVAGQGGTQLINYINFNTGFFKLSPYCSEVPNSETCPRHACPVPK